MRVAATGVFRPAGSRARPAIPPARPLGDRLAIIVCLICDRAWLEGARRFPTGRAPRFRVCVCAGCRPTIVAGLTTHPRRRAEAHEGEDHERV